jgi:hypothetical protein
LLSRRVAGAARTSAALDEFVAQHRLDALAYYHKGSGNAANEDTMSSIILGSSLLTARHIPLVREYEVKNALAMEIMDVLGAGGSFIEYAMDFNDDLVLMGHDGPGHIAICEGNPPSRSFACLPDLSGGDHPAASACAPRRNRDTADGLCNRLRLCRDHGLGVDRDAQASAAVVGIISSAVEAPASSRLDPAPARRSGADRRFHVSLSRH